MLWVLGTRVGRTVVGLFTGFAVLIVLYYWIDSTAVRRTLDKQELKEAQEYNATVERATKAPISRNATDARAWLREYGTREPSSP